MFLTGRQRFGAFLESASSFELPPHVRDGIEVLREALAVSPSPAKITLLRKSTFEIPWDASASTGEVARGQTVCPECDGREAIVAPYARTWVETVQHPGGRTLILSDMESRGATFQVSEALANVCGHVGALVPLRGRPAYDGSDRLLLGFRPLRRRELGECTGIVVDWKKLSSGEAELTVVLHPDDARVWAPTGSTVHLDAPRFQAKLENLKGRLAGLAIRPAAP